MKNILLSTLALAVCAMALPARASTITISLVDPHQTGQTGQTLQYFGVITNNTNSTVNLDSDDLILNAPGIALIDDFGNTPFFLTPDGTSGSSSGIIELFDVALSSGFTGQNIGPYDIVGDTGGNSSVLYTTTFSVVPPPPPPALFLLLPGLPPPPPRPPRRLR